MLRFPYCRWGTGLREQLQYFHSLYPPKPSYPLLLATWWERITSKSPFTKEAQGHNSEEKNVHQCDNTSVLPSRGRLCSTKENIRRRWGYHRWRSGFYWSPVFAYGVSFYPLNQYVILAKELPSWSQWIAAKFCFYSLSFSTLQWRGWFYLIAAIPDMKPGIYFTQPANTGHIYYNFQHWTALLCPHPGNPNRWIQTSASRKSKPPSCIQNNQICGKLGWEL